MNMIRFEPWSLMSQLHNEMNRLYNRDEAAATDWVPAVDIKEEAERFVIHADVPGVDPKDIEVTMEDGILTLRGERKSEVRDEKDGWRRVERVNGQFFRRFTLPDTANAEGVSARGSNGVLEIVIPKHAKVQPRRITVKAA
ncbi:MAG TPA: Hsp20/alpha crystallin family protein [Gammaproteobacteria bacterium]|jgi:HSP20 family protein|nr:Hsp20/alpha crystallin family protein [Gammaproteobacteria bacterium]